MFLRNTPVESTNSTISPGSKSIVGLPENAKHVRIFLPAVPSKVEEVTSLLVEYVVLKVSTSAVNLLTSPSPNSENKDLTLSLVYV